MKTLVPPFQLAAPSDWSCLSVILAGPIQEETDPNAVPFRPNLFVNVDDIGPNAKAILGDYVAAQVRQLSESEAFVRMIAAPQQTKTKGGIDGFVYEYIVKSPHEGMNVHQMQFVTVFDDTVYAFTWSQVSGQPFLKSKTAFRQMLDSLEPSK